ncbi:MAG: DUF4258 domain-containing protein [Chthonomonadales bacterium]
MPDPIRTFTVTPHAADQMRRREIDEATLTSVLSAPERRLPVRAGRDLLERVVEFGGRPYLVRVIVDVDRTPAEVVTVYRTSKIEKYRRERR